MVRILSISLFLFLAFTIYYDLTTGSLPQKSDKESQTQLQSTQQPDLQSIDVLIQPGDTVLSIHEHLMNGEESPVSISQLILDFEALNPGIQASQINIGMIYHFPVYIPA